jgi:hypothetical protein
MPTYLRSPVSPLEDIFDIEKYNACDNLTLWQWSNALFLRWIFQADKFDGFPDADKLQEVKNMVTGFINKPITEIELDRAPLRWSPSGRHGAIREPSNKSKFLTSHPTAGSPTGLDSECAEPVAVRVYNEAFFCSLEVDLWASDEQIKKDFSLWLTAKRNEIAEAPTFNDFSSGVFRNWCKHRVLGFIDLELYAVYHDLILPNHLIGKLLFPDEFGIDTGERVRKVVRPLAHKILEGRNILALGKAAEKEYYASVGK